MNAGPASALALKAAALLAVDPIGLKGAVLRSPPSPALDAWLAAFRGVQPPGAPWRKLPASASAGRLIGGLDLSASLSAGKPLFERGLLAEADGGVITAPMAERLEAETAAIICAALDEGAVRAERDGFSRVEPARFALLLIDEGAGEDERLADALADRVAFILEPVAVSACELDARRIADARATLAGVAVPEPLIEALAAAAMRYGVLSLRVLSFAVAAARAAAALEGRDKATEQDSGLAAALVIGPRARALPEEAPQEPAPPPERDESPGDSENVGDGALADRVVAAVKASIDAALFSAAAARRGAARASGKSGAVRKSLTRGRPYGSRSGDPSRGGRLQLIDTLRAAAPWQKIRGRANGAMVAVRRDDLRIARFRRPEQSLAIFVVDASGSAAMQRLGETKGAIEQLFAQSYSRRDEVALIAFRKAGAEILVPPTRSLVRARRLLAELPGGGGTPLAAGVNAAAALAAQATKRGRTPTIVFMTDGRANVALNGEGGREAAQRDAIAAAKKLRALGQRVLLFDTSARPEPQASALAAEMGAQYLPLPRADARLVASAVARR
jgi:magnesium chelatase subunit D